MTGRPSCFASAARVPMASAPWCGSFSASTSRGASEPAKADRGALRGAIEKAEAPANSNSIMPGRAQSNHRAAQPSPSSQQDHLTDIAARISDSQGHGDANSIAVQPGAAATAPRPPFPLVARDEDRYFHWWTPPRTLNWEALRVSCRIECVSGAVACPLAHWRIMRCTKAGQDPEIFCHHISVFLIAPRECRHLESDIANLIRVAGASSPGWLAPIADPTHVPRRSSTSSLDRMQVRRVARGGQEERMRRKAARKRRTTRRARQLLGRAGRRRCFSACHTSLRDCM